jgi:hypothetical protein
MDDSVIMARALSRVLGEVAEDLGQIPCIDANPRIVWDGIRGVSASSESRTLRAKPAPLPLADRCHSLLRP